MAHPVGVDFLGYILRMGIICEILQEECDYVSYYPYFITKDLPSL